uniref:Major facilitator superfamily associated domain-containing protein n=2 Tax=Meloidogyne incognita TaxID=6306 RepID=A0A914MD32_MELIC
MEQPSVNFFGRVIPKDVFFVRLFYLLYFASFGSLFPLLAVYFKQLGLSAAQAGILLGSRPIVEFVASPFWGSFADRFKKVKLLLLFSVGSMIVFTLAVGFVQPLTPYCVVLDKNNTGGECKFLVPASKIIRGGALGYIKKVADIGRRRKRDILSIIDLSTFDNNDDFVYGKAPEYITKEKVCDYDENLYGILVSPPHSTRVYREQAVEQAFMLLWLLIALGEFFSSPTLPLADSYTLSLVSETPKDFGKFRLYGSAGWGFSMLLMGIGLDFSDTFHNHPCPTKNTTERNYTLCFVTCTLFALTSMAIITQFRFPQSSEQHRPDEVNGLVMDTRIEELDPTVAQKTRAKQLNAKTEEGTDWKNALKAMLLNIHFVAFLLGIICIGFGAGNAFAFLFWHLQDLGGSPSLFGMASVANHAAEICSFFYAFKVINKHGYIKTLYICLGTNVVRFLMLSWLTNPWLVLPLQILQGTVHSISWAMATSYVSIVSPPHLKGNSQHILTILYHGLGRGVGPIIGGFFIRSYGTRAWFALLAFITLCILGAFYAVNLKLKNAAVKYGGFDAFDDEVGGGGNLAPQGLPMHRLGDNKITEAFNQTPVASQSYGALDGLATNNGNTRDERDDAYDRYVTGKN